MRQRASTDLCGGRSAMIVPTASIPRRPLSRRIGEGHAELPESRTEAQRELNRDFHAASGWSAPSVHWATGRVGSFLLASFPPGSPGPESPTMGAVLQT